MQILKRPEEIPLEHLIEIANQVSRDRYAGNVYVETSGSSDSHRFTLRCHSSKAEGARTSSSGRRTVSACWHAHRDILNAVFEAHPRGRIKTAMADYRGLEGFLEAYPATAWKNIGNMIYPAYMPELCDHPAGFPYNEAYHWPPETILRFPNFPPVKGSGEPVWNRS